MSKALINALTLAVAEAFDTPLSVARNFAEGFVSDNGELLTPAAPAARAAAPGPHRLSPGQQMALDGNVPLCQNCQQPVTDHLPNCARATAIDQRAVTKDPLAPVA